MLTSLKNLAGAAALILLSACMATPMASEPPVLAQLGRDTDVLMIGEVHGTAEAPAAFGDLVELAARRQRLAVCLELSQADIEAAGCGRPRPAAGSKWLNPRQDGRTSQGMRALVCRLAALQGKARISLFGFAPSSRPAPGRHPLADPILARPRGTPMLLFVGNFHARRTAGSLAQALTEAGLRLVTVTVSSPGGTAYNCDRRGNCGPRPTAARFCAAEATTPTLVVGAPAALPPELPWDGCLILPATTASPPV